MTQDIRVTGLDHIVLNVADVERSLGFYLDELGLEPVRVEEWRVGQAPFPSARVDGGTIIDLLAADRSGVNADHFCLVVEAMDFDALKDRAGSMSSTVPTSASAPAVTASRCTSGIPTATPSSCGTTNRRLPPGPVAPPAQLGCR
jgi:hypothetical protein